MVRLLLTSRVYYLLISYRRTHWRYLPKYKPLELWNEMAFVRRSIRQLEDVSTHIQSICHPTIVHPKTPPETEPQLLGDPL